MSAIIKYPEEIQKCLDIYEPYAIQFYEGKLEGVPQEAIDAYNKAKNGFGNKNSKNKSTKVGFFFCLKSGDLIWKL